jgi:hypothetical protein
VVALNDARVGECVQNLFFASATWWQAGILGSDLNAHEPSIDALKEQIVERFAMNRDVLGIVEQTNGIRCSQPMFIIESRLGNRTTA